MAILLNSSVRRVWVTALGIMVLVLTTVGPAYGALPDTQTPVLALDHLIQTSPFIGSSVSMRDDEGSTYVPRDNSFWLADDDARRVYEIDATTGALERTFDRSTFENVPQYGGGPLAGVDRDRDLESLAYDDSTDTLYAFSGPCCTSTVLPTSFRFQRVDGQLQPVDYQALSDTADFTAAAWNPTEQKVYVGVRSDIQSYDYATNTAGQVFHVPALGGIMGLVFTPDGKDLLVARSQLGGTNPYQLLSRVDWATRTLVPGWTFDLTPFGVKDARGVELVDDQIYISDGYDQRQAGDPEDHAVFVFDVTAYTGTVVTPTAAFTAAQEPDNPLTVHFTDISLDRPTSWKWQFGDGMTNTLQNPAHRYAAPGTYTVKLTATNAAGSTFATEIITVPLEASFTAPPASGEAPLDVSLQDTSSGEPGTWAWDFGDGTRSGQQNPTHRFTNAGDYTVSLTVTSFVGSSVASKVISVAAAQAPPPPPPAPVAAFAMSPQSGAAPLLVGFTDSSTGSPTSWTWDFGDGATSSVQNPTHAFSRPGDYTVTLTAVNGSGQDAVSQVVHVQDLRAADGLYVVRHWLAIVRQTRVAIVQQWLDDDFTANEVIRRVVRWGDGTGARTWGTGTVTRHIYHRTGVFHPRLVLTDEAGNERVVHLHRVVVRR